jgi:HSP90 family molecular chaperone
MVSTAFDEDTDSGSINLDELEELATSGGALQHNLLIKVINPKSIGDELRSINKVSVSKARVYKKNYESVVNSLKESVESANDNIATLKELAAKENKSHMESWDKVTSPRMAQIQLSAMRKQSTQ